jgi:hypothetical protein
MFLKSTHTVYRGETSQYSTPRYDEMLWRVLSVILRSFQYPGYLAWDARMPDEFESTWKETVPACYPGSCLEELGKTIKTSITTATIAGVEIQTKHLPNTSLERDC